MTKDEMKNKISMALKDPTLQQGFEIICKENAEFKEQLYAFDEEREKLRKENAELERKLEQTEKDLADYQFNYPTIKEMQKENAELKEYNKYLKRKRQGGIQKQYNKVAIIKQQKEQLTKAKEIIKTFCGFCSVFNSTNGSLDNLIAEAERFLSEE